MKILLADDHSIIRRLVKKLLLTEFPLALIEEVKNGVELLARIAGSPWDLVISDISMPEMNGLEAVREIRKFSLTLPVLILSSHTGDEYVEYAMRLGASGYVHKYNVHQELGNAVRKVLEDLKSPRIQVLQQA
jgi:two-component system, NarL family, invasion response regulator UvrY